MMDLIDLYKNKVEDMMTPYERRWMNWQEDLEYIKMGIRDIATDFIGGVQGPQQILQLRYRIQEYLQYMRQTGMVADYKIDELNSQGLRVMVQFPGAIDYRIISMRWS